MQANPFSLLVSLTIDKKRCGIIYIYVNSALVQQHCTRETKGRSSPSQLIRRGYKFDARPIIWLVSDSSRQPYDFENAGAFRQLSHYYHSSSARQTRQAALWVLASTVFNAAFFVLNGND